MPKSSVIGTEFLVGDPMLEEEFMRLKKRDLTDTYRFQVACGSFRPTKCSASDFRKHIMDKMNIFPTTRRQPKHFGNTADVSSSDHKGAAGLYTCFPGDKPPEHPDWIRDRKAFRKALDGMGNLHRWVRNKPILTDLEVIVSERDRQAKQISSFRPERRIIPSPPTPDESTSTQVLRADVEEVKSFLRMHDAFNLSKLLDWHGIGKLKRADLSALFKKEGFLIHPERLNVLMSSLKSKDGNSVTVEDLAAGIQAWIRKQDREEQKTNPDDEKGIWSGRHLTMEKEDQQGMQDVEVLAVMRRVLAALKISCPSSLGGSMGREVDRFRRLCFRQYLKSLKQCRQQELNVSQATLQKVLLHPGDVNSDGHFLGCGGREQGLAAFRTSKSRGVEDGACKNHKEMKKQPIRWANPNAFWPGKEDHVRLFLPVMTSSPAMVLFQHIEPKNPKNVSSRGHWPVNHLGYSTSGDIEARKTYTL